MPLRVIHTADWHLGQSLRGYSRDFEHAAVLAHLITLIAETKPDALIIAGDVFDSPNPSAEAQTLFFRTLVRLHQSCPSMTIVVTAGNHDAAIRLEAPRDLLATIGVHIVGNVRRLNGRTLTERHLVPILSPSGIPIGHILGISYPTAACLPAVPTANGSSRLITAVEHLYADLVRQTRSQWEGLPLILTGHLHVSGARQSDGAERPILIGGENAIPSSKFPPEAVYIALGHLHEPQAAGAPHIRYSGSLIPLSASEIDYEHGVTLLDIDGSSTSIQHLPLPRPIPFHRLPSSGFASQSELPTLLTPLRASPATPPDQRPFVYLRLRREGLNPAFREEIDNLASENGLRVLEIRLEDPPVNHTDAQSNFPSRTVLDHDPVEFFRLAFLRTHQKDPAPAHSEIFQKAYEEAQHA